MSLLQGWDKIPPEHGGRTPAAGDLILLQVRKPATVTGPPGWLALGEFTWTGDDGRDRTGHAFAKVIGPRELDPVFTTTEQQPDWEILGHAMTGYAPASENPPGSAVPWSPRQGSALS